MGSNPIPTVRAIDQQTFFIASRNDAMEHAAEVKGIGIGMAGDGEQVPAVILEAREELIPIFITADQAQSMHLAQQGEPFERPLTHDLLVEMVAEFGGAIDRVRIDEMSNGTFFAKVDAEQYHGGERRTMVFDARPSDGIALALRVECEILVSDEVIDEAGQPDDAIDLIESDEEER